LENGHIAIDLVKFMKLRYVISRLSRRSHVFLLSSITVEDEYLQYQNMYL